MVCWLSCSGSYATTCMTHRNCIQDAVSTACPAGPAQTTKWFPSSVPASLFLVRYRMASYDTSLDGKSPAWEGAQGHRDGPEAVSEKVHFPSQRHSNEHPHVSPPSSGTTDAHPAVEGLTGLLNHKPNTLAKPSLTESP